MSEVSEDYIECTAKVIEVLPKAQFRVILEEQNNHEIIAYISGKMRKNKIRVLVGDYVTIVTTKYDFTKGRIIKRV